MAYIYKYTGCRDITQLNVVSLVHVTILLLTTGKRILILLTVYNMLLPFYPLIINCCMTIINNFQYALNMEIAIDSQQKKESFQLKKKSLIVKVTCVYNIIYIDLSHLSLI